MRHRASRGFNLIELMIALVLGFVLLGAFLAILSVCRERFAINDSVARLQDSARHAWSVLVPDVEHAGFYGFTREPTALRLVRDAAVIADARDLRQPGADRTVAPVAGLPAGAHACGINFAVDVSRPVQASNNSFAAGVSARDCAPTASAGGARAGRIQVYSRRLASMSAHDLFADGRAPGALNEDHEVRDLEVRTYYIANDSVERPGWPALRVKGLTEARGAAQFRDEEVLPGVEDLQVELGIQARVDGAASLRFVAPDAPEILQHPVVAVRLWLRIRADQTEPGFSDQRRWRYADVDFSARAPEDSHRRIVITRTVTLRAARR